MREERGVGGFLFSLFGRAVFFSRSCRVRFGVRSIFKSLAWMIKFIDGNMFVERVRGGSGV